MHSAKSLFSSTFPQLWISLFSNTFIWWTLFKLIIIITRRWSERKGDPTKTKIWLCGRIKMNRRLHFSQCETNGAKKKKKKMNDMKNELTTLHWHSTSVEEKKKMLFSFFFFAESRHRNIFCLFWRWYVSFEKATGQCYPAAKIFHIFRFAFLYVKYVYLLINFGRWQMGKRGQSERDQIWCDGGTIINIVLHRPITASKHF